MDPLLGSSSSVLDATNITVEVARQRYASLIAFLAWAVLYQSVKDTFAAHPSFQKWSRVWCAGAQASPLVYALLSFAVQICSAFAIWVYFLVPGTNTAYHIAVLTIWAVRAMLNRVAYTLFPLTEIHLEFRIAIDLLIWLLDWTLVILLIIEACLRPDRDHVILSAALFLPPLVLDGVVCCALLWYSCQ